MHLTNLTALWYNMSKYIQLEDYIEYNGEI